jgi:hypothetical protein
MRRYVSFGVVLIGLLLAGNAIGDGNELLTRCAVAVNFMDGTSKADSGAEFGNGMFCLGMMQGITSMNTFYEVELGKKALFCTPKAITNGQAARIVVKYLREHPEKLHEHDSLLAIEALMKAFPCK